MKPRDKTLPVLVLTMDGSARFRLPIRSRGATACFAFIAIVESLATRSGWRASAPLDTNRGADRSKGTDAGRSVAPCIDVVGRWGRWLVCILLTSEFMKRFTPCAMRRGTEPAMRWIEGGTRVQRRKPRTTFETWGWVVFVIWSRHVRIERMRYINAQVFSFFLLCTFPFSLFFPPFDLYVTGTVNTVKSDLRPCLHWKSALERSTVGDRTKL